MCRTQCALVLLALFGFAHSWDFAMNMGDQLLFYTNGAKTDTVRFDSQNISALAFDGINNVILYVDKQGNNDVICAFNVTSWQSKYITKTKGRNIHDLAYDPATEKLFFTDLNERSINWISLKPGSDNVNLVIKIEDGVPTDIAVDSCRGYIYWINVDLIETTIERARFNGFQREYVISLRSLSLRPTDTLEAYNLVIDQQLQKMFWVEPGFNSSLHNVYEADLNGKDKKKNFYFFGTSHALTVSKTSLFTVTFSGKVVRVYKKIGTENFKEFINFRTEIPVGIVANYKIGEQIEGLTNCEALTSLVPYNSVNNDSMKIATACEGPFCVNGMISKGQSHCKCAPGYTGERCDVSVCENYCLHGTCTINDGGLPNCSCNAGYSGERCEVYACHNYCLNEGNCSLNKDNEPVCNCVGTHQGPRCEAVQAVSVTVPNITLNDNPSSKM